MADDAVRHEVSPQDIGAEALEDGAEHRAAVKRNTPRTAPPLPNVRRGFVARQEKRPAVELRDLDAAFRGRFFDLFAKPEVMARVERLLLSDDDQIALKALRTVLETIPMQRKEAESDAPRSINLNFGNVPRPERDVTPR